jgi:penicillin-binding protein 1A
VAGPKAASKVFPRPRKQQRPEPALWQACGAWLAWTAWRAGRGTAEAWTGFSLFFERFRLRGIRRFAVELFSETLTLGTAGAFLALALALPAFRATDEDWRTEDDFAVTFLDRYGAEIGRRGSFRRDSVDVDAMPPALVAAVLATEDRRFFSHWGIDPAGLARALSANLEANGVVQGGSTLTQQLAKNLFLSNERTVERKVKEAFLALWLEANLSKKEILQLYLDRAYMGGPAFGVSAAAEFYFGKKLRDLDLAECAMLAGLFKAPSRYAPHRNLAAAQARADEVLTNLVESGFMTEGEVREARLHPAGAVERGTPEHPDWFLDWAYREVRRIARPLKVRTLVARTTVDLDLQREAEAALEWGLRDYGGQYGVEEGAVVLMETGGAVRAIVGGRDYGRSQFNRATAAERQAGSSFKPFVYALAMEEGMTPDTTVSDAPITWGNWSPRNYGRSFNGRVTLSTALALSINTVPVRLAKEHLGIAPIARLAAAMGIESPLNGHKTMVLGTSGVTPMDQATAYNSFADGGFSGARFGVVQLLAPGGRVVWDHARDAPAPRRVLSERAVAAMNAMLGRVPVAGTAKRAALAGIPSAGKTGTTQSYRDAWYVGFTGNYTAAVWLGNDDFSPTRGMTGGSLPALVWQRLMTAAHRDGPLKPIPGLLPPPAPTKPAASAAAAPPREPERRRPLSEATAARLRALNERFRLWPGRPAPQVVSRL